MDSVPTFVLSPLPRWHDAPSEVTRPTRQHTTERRGISFARFYVGRLHANTSTMKFDQQKINQAIRDCISSSQNASDRLAKIEGFLLRLEMGGLWTDDGLNEGERGCRKILLALMDDANLADEGPEAPADRSD
jgi:hypothetical protein